ncbi:MAG TPA: hypothetical protein VHP36_02365 [Chitinispirillaceae bacterium]|nr:hypothetical protein [Chitinispirillaceae bacterium]
MKLIIYLIYSILTLNTMSQEHFLIVPQDEKTAEKLITEGKLDPDFFELIRPFYNQPLDVPQGELKILLELLPQLSSEIPASVDSLEKYKPWDQSAILRFFLDYPSVAQFEPILRFDIKPIDFRAKTAFSVNSQEGSNQLSHGANLQIRLFKAFRIDTRITFNNDHALWYRRAFVFTPSEICTLQAGNYGLFFDHGLFLGYFPRSESDSSLKHNWLYGDATTWNGIKISVGGKEKGFLNHFSTMTFFHKRETESSAGAILSLKPNDIFCFNSGLSMLYLRDSLCKTYHFRYVHYGMKINHEWLNVELQSGLDMQNSDCTPLLINSKLCLDRNEFEFKWVYLPKGMHAPYSYVIQKIDNKNHTVSDAVYSFTLQSTHHSCRWFSIIPSAYMVIKNKITEKFCFNLCIRGSFRNFMYDAAYSWQPSSALIDSSGNAFHTVLSVFATRRITIKSEIDFISNNRNRQSLSGCLSSKMDFLPALSLKPSILISKSDGKTLLVAYGFEHVLKLQDKIFTQFTIGQNIKGREKGELLSVDAKTSFVF